MRNSTWTNSVGPPCPSACRPRCLIFHFQIYKWAGHMRHVDQLHQPMVASGPPNGQRPACCPMRLPRAIRDAGLCPVPRFPARNHYLREENMRYITIFCFSGKKCGTSPHVVFLANHLEKSSSGGTSCELGICDSPKGEGLLHVCTTTIVDI